MMVGGMVELILRREVGSHCKVVDVVVGVHVSVGHGKKVSGSVVGKDDRASFVLSVLFIL